MTHESGQSPQESKPTSRLRRMFRRPSLFLKILFVLLWLHVGLIISFQFVDKPTQQSILEIAPRFSRLLMPQKFDEKKKKKSFVHSSRAYHLKLRDAGGAKAKSRKRRRLPSRRAGQRKRNPSGTPPIDMQKMEKALRRKAIVDALNKKSILSLLGRPSSHGSILSAKGFGGDDADALGSWTGSRVGRSGGGGGLGLRGGGGGGGGFSGSSVGLGKLGTYGRGGGKGGRGWGSSRSSIRSSRRKRSIRSRLSIGNIADGSRAAVARRRKRRVRVWRRTRQNTILSQVSVGGKKTLILKKLRVTVQIDGIRARTIMDHIYYNPHGRTLQGTFKYTLPTDASVSYYAMFVGRRRRRAPRFFSGKVARGLQSAQWTPEDHARRVPRSDWGNLREARLVPAEKGREVYEEITRRRIDPALLEQDAPNTFSGRVFPIRAQGYNRIIIAYEQTLPTVRKLHMYRFRFPNQVGDLIDFTVEHNPSLARLTQHNLQKLRCRGPRKGALRRCVWEKNKPKRDAVLFFHPRRKDLAWVSGEDPTDQRRYLFARLRLPAWSTTKTYSAKQAIFMLDTSLSQTPALFAAHVSLLMQILRRNQSQLKRFNVLFFDTHARWAAPQGWLPNTPAQRARMHKKLQRILLEGATSLDAALSALRWPPWKLAPKTPVDIFFLSDGQLSWGATRSAALLARFQHKHPFGQLRFFAYKTGLGSENVALYRRLARKGGAVFSCLGRDEIPRCATAHTRPSMILERVAIEGIGASELLVQGRKTNLYAGARLVLAARYLRDGAARIVLQGRFLGQSRRLVYTFNVKSRGDLAPRAWAEIAINQMLALHDNGLRKMIVSYARHFHIPNKHCSFLVLETDKEYKQYGLTYKYSTHRALDLARFLARRQPQPGQLAPKTYWLSLLRKGVRRARASSRFSSRAVLSFVQRLPASSFHFSTARTSRNWTRTMVSARYRKRRRKARHDFSIFVKEARRRLRRDVAGAVRSLSSVVELHPNDARALRLVGYTLNAWNKPAEAVHLFLRVLERRSFEPHAYRDLARTLLRLRRVGLASALYEMILASPWDRRFKRIKTIAREEYALLVQNAMRDERLLPTTASFLRQRKAILGLSVRPSKLRVTVTWNTDNTDIDLWVREPSGEKCYYSRKSTRNGGRLLDDVTRGYGPERYENIGGRKGKYRLQLHFYGHSSNTFGNVTHASVLIVLHAGTRRQRIIEKNITLRRGKQIASIASFLL